MPDPADQPQAPSAARPARWRFLVWLVCGTAALAVLAYFVAHLPRKPLALGAVAYGTVATWGLAWLAAEWRVRWSRSLVVAAAGLVLAGQVGIAAESHRTFAAAGRAYWGPDRRGQLLTRMREGGASAEDVAPLVQAIEERRRALAARTSFSAYLAHRLSGVVQLASDSPWPAIIWLAEVLIGTAAGLWLGWRLARFTGLADVRTA